MAETTGIAWTRSTFNPWIGCTKVGPGCDHCYAETQDSRKRWGGVTHWGAGVPRHRTSVSTWKAPLAWNRKAQATGEFWPVFCASLADVFDNEVPDEWRADLFRVIEQTPALTWQLVTKRIGNVMGMVPTHWRAGFPPNVWQIATIVNRVELHRDGDKLSRIPAVVRGVSYEPALQAVSFAEWLPRINWIIVGGESGRDARAFDPTWARSVIKQCRDASVPVFVKQLGTRPQEIAYPDEVSETEAHRWMNDGWTRIWIGKGSHWRRYMRLKDRAGADPAEWPEDLRVREFPE